MKKLFLFLSFFLFAFFAKSQINNDSLEFRIRPDEFKAGRLDLSLYNFNFLRNYEFFNKFQDGYTLYGTQLEPQLIYYPQANLALTAGVHLRKDFGNAGIREVLPLFSLKYQKGNTAIIAGTLEGNIHHRYIEPVFDFESKILNPVEYGTQVVIQNRRLFFDGFINWQKMIYKPSTEQEQIVAGISSDISLYRKNNWNLSAPIQLLVYHQGGQIDINPKPLQTIINSALGFKLSKQTSGFIRKVEAGNYIVSFQEMSPTKILAFSKGDALYVNAGFETRYGSLIASYWKGNRFIATRGMPIYQSVSSQINNQDYSEKKRKLLILRYVYQRKLVPNLFLDFRVEPFIDLINTKSKIDFHHSLFFVYKQNIRLLKVE